MKGGNINLCIYIKNKLRNLGKIARRQFPQRVKCMGYIEPIWLCILQEDLK